MQKQQNQNLFDNFMASCIVNINTIFDSKLAERDEYGRNEHGYIASFLNSNDPELTVENVKKNPLLLAQLENMFISALEHHVIEKTKNAAGKVMTISRKKDINNNTLAKDLAAIAVPINEYTEDNLPTKYADAKNKFTDKVFGKREAYIIESIDFITKGKDVENLIENFLKENYTSEKYYVDHRTKYDAPTYLPYDLDITKHDKKNYKLSHINNNEGLVYRAKNLDFDKQKDLASMIRGVRANDQKAEIHQPEWTQKPITELRAGTDMFSIKGSPHETFFHPSYQPNDDKEKILNYDKKKFYSYKNIDINGALNTDVLQGKFVKINLLNSKISDKIKGFGAGISGTSMSFYTNTLNYMQRNNIEDPDNSKKIEIIKSIITHACGLNIHDSLDLDNAISFDENGGIVWNIEDSIKVGQKHTESLHHSLPEVMMGIEIGKMLVDNGLDFGDNKCSIEFSELAKNIEDIAIKCWDAIDKNNAIKLKNQLHTSLDDVVDNVYSKYDDAKLFDLKKDDSKIPLKQAKEPSAKKLSYRLSSLGDFNSGKQSTHYSKNYSISKKITTVLDPKKDKIVNEYLENITSGNEVNKLRDAKSLYLKESDNIKNNRCVESYFDEKIKLALLKQRKDLFGKKTVVNTR